MKTKEEIEKLAEKEYREYPNNPLDEPAWHYNKDIHCHKKRKAFTKAYTQCQEDNKHKKYTEEDIKKAFMAGCQSERRFSRRIDELDKYINSLNKQD
jgi:hypothetical protein